MDAIEMLERQHREVEELFEKFEGAGPNARKTKEKLCREISDKLAVHAEIEEKLFYPEVKTDETEEMLREAVEEHLSVKRVLADLLETEVQDEQFDARMKVLKEQIEHHVEEEEEELFPKVKQAMSEDELDDLGSRMEELAEEVLAQGSPSRDIPGQTDSPAPI